MAGKKDVRIKTKRAYVPKKPPAAAPEETPEKKDRARSSRRRPRSAAWLLLSRLMLVSALVVMGALVWKNWDSLAPAELFDWIDQKITGGDGGSGFPVSISGNTVVALSPVKSGVGILTDTSLLLMDANGAELMRRSHTYARPMLRTAGDYLLIAELGGTRFQLETRKETVFSGTVANDIRSVAVGPDGMVAVATASTKSYLSEMVVFDKSGKEIFHWYSTELMAADVALRRDGKQAAVIGLSTEKGAMKSTLLVLDIQSGATEPVASHSGTDVLLCTVSFLPNGQVAAVGDTACWLFTADAENSTCVPVSYEDRELLGYAVGDKGIALALRHYGANEDGELLLTDADGTVIGTEAFEGDFRHLAKADNGFYLLTATRLYQVADGAFAANREVPADGLMVTTLKDDALVLGLTTLQTYTF